MSLTNGNPQFYISTNFQFILFRNMNLVIENSPWCLLTKKQFRTTFLIGYSDISWFCPIIAFVRLRVVSNMATRGECTSSLISVRDFKRQFLEFLEPASYERKRKEVLLTDMVAEMDLPMETIADLNEVCRYALNCSDEKIILHQVWRRMLAVRLKFCCWCTSCLHVCFCGCWCFS